MGMLDKFLDVMRLNSDDDDFYDDDYYDDDYEEEKPKRRSSTKEKNSEAEEESYEEKRPRPVKSQKVTPMRPSKRQNVSGMEVCVIKPTTVDDAREITETLLLDRTVVLNVEGLDVDIAQRIIDFTSGSCFAISGNLQKISNYIFIITPPSVDISGDFATNIMDSFDVPPIKEF
ncbi:cell division inhibitor SepF [Lachnospiraceae bacterium 3-1]|nr:cell division inhibitor SepF [Lachnospiraceae bacterium 3-1]